MLVRIISSVVGLPILIVLVVFGGIWLQFGISVLSLIGLFEFYRALKGKIIPIHYVGFAMTLLYLSFIQLHLLEYVPVLINIFVVVLMSLQAFFREKNDIKDVAVTITGFFYISYTFGNITILRQFSSPFADMGFWIVWLVFISAWCCDTGAYFTGLLFGKHKLAPVLSPKKTVEGAIGGVIWSSAGCALYGVYINCAVLETAKNFSESNIDIIVIFAIIGFIASIFAQVGDLAASAVKRHTGIKDYGSIMPGHGGVLDRFDSVIFTSAAVFVLAKIIL